MAPPESFSPRRSTDRGWARVCDAAGRLGLFEGRPVRPRCRSIWASWSVVTRLAVTTSLDAWDIAALGFAGFLLSPVLMRRGFALDRLGWLGLAVLIAGQGAPYVLVAAAGLRFAPARDGGALNPGCMPLFVALIMALALAEKLSAPRKFGLALMLAGALAIIGSNAANWGASRIFGDALFLCAAFLSACSTVAMRQAKLDPLHTAALISTASLVIAKPVATASPVVDLGL